MYQGLRGPGHCDTGGGGCVALDAVDFARDSLALMVDNGIWLAIVAQLPCAAAVRGRFRGRKGSRTDARGDLSFTCGDWGEGGLDSFPIVNTADGSDDICRATSGLY